MLTKGNNFVILFSFTARSSHKRYVTSMIAQPNQESHYLALRLKVVLMHLFRHTQVDLPHAWECNAYLKNMR